MTALYLNAYVRRKIIRATLRKENASVSRWTKEKHNKKKYEIKNPSI